MTSYHIKIPDPTLSASGLLAVGPRIEARCWLNKDKTECLAGEFFESSQDFPVRNLPHS